MIAASLVLLALLAGIAGTTFGLIRRRGPSGRSRAAAEGERADKATPERSASATRRSRRRRSLERDKAIAAEAKTRAINDFLTQDLLTQAEPANNAAEDKVTLLEVLDRAAEKVGQRFADQPELEAALRETIASTYHGLASWEKAEAQWRAVLEAARKRDPRSAEAYRAQGELAHILRHRGRRDAEVVEMAERPPRGSSARSAPTTPTPWPRSTTSPAYQDAGKLPEAIALFERVRDAQIAKLGPDHPDTLTTLNNLAVAYRTPASSPRRSPCSSASATPRSPSSAPTTPTP